MSDIPSEGQTSLTLIPSAKIPKNKVYTPSEHEIEMAIGHLLRIKGIFFWKNPSAGYFDSKQKRFRRHVNPYALNGAPDLICIYRGLFIGLEVKSGKGKMSASQVEFERRVRAAGGHYYLVRSVSDVDVLFKKLKEIVPLSP